MIKLLNLTKLRFPLLILISLFLFTACTSVAHKSEFGSLLSLRAQANAAYELGDWEQASVTLEKLTQEVGKDPELWFRLGNCYTRLHQPEQALLAYEEVIVRQPDHAKALYNMSVVRMRQAIAVLMEMRRRLATDDPMYLLAEQKSSKLIELLAETVNLDESLAFSE